MLLRKMFRDIKTNVTQFISIFIMSVLGVLVFSGINAEWYGMESEADRYYEESRMPEFWIMGQDFSRETAAEVSKIPGVLTVSRRLTLDSVAVLEGRPTIRLNIVEDNQLSRPHIVEGAMFDTTQDGLWLDASFAEAHHLKIGGFITLEAFGLKINKKILGFILHPEYVYNVKDESELLPNPNVFGFAFMTQNALPAEIPLPNNQLLIKAAMDANLPVVHSSLETTLFGKYSLILTRDNHPSTAMFRSEIEQSKAMGGVFPVVFFLIAALSMLTTMTRLVSNQRTQIGTLKAMGFKRRKILFHYVSYGLWIGLAGGIIGLFTGPLIIPPILFTMQKSLYSLPDWYAIIVPTDWTAVAVAVLCCSASSYFACRKELSEVPAATLRPRAPKIGRHTRWEKSRSWHKLGFSVQWNIRDIFRSKVRSIMAVAGVTGSMALLLCALGLSDTVSGISNWMYGDLHTYQSKIILKEDISAEEKGVLKDRYSGQWVQESGIEINKNGIKKTGSLTVLGEGTQIRFKDSDHQPIELPGSGIALSYKMAGLLHAEIGDKIEWRLYGQNTWQQSEILKIFRTPMGQGIAMSEEAYEKTGDTMKPSALLSAHLVKDAEKLPGVKGVQEKADLIKSFSTMLESMQMMIGILILAAVILGVVVLYNLGALSFTERLRELATLKVLGLFSRKIRSLLQKQNIWLTVLGIFLGIPCGYALVGFILSTMTDTMDMFTRITPYSLVLCCSGTFLLSVSVNYLLSHKVKTIDMVSSLKAVE